MRDASYSSMLGHPASAAIDEWRAIYRAVARRNGAEPDAGRHLVAWLQEAGLPLASIRHALESTRPLPTPPDFRGTRTPHTPPHSGQSGP